MLTGDANANVLTGGSQADTLTGGAGADTLVGGAGADSLVGGADVDTVDYSSSTSGVTVNLSLATSQSGGDAAGDTLSGIENAVGSRTASNVLTGDSNANVITGGAVADTLNGGTGTDTVDYSGSTAGVTVNLALSTSQSGGDAAGTCSRASRT